MIFKERKSSFSLDLLSFGPSVLDGARSKVDLRGEGYALAPIWWSSYLVYFLAKSHVYG